MPAREATTGEKDFFIDRQLLDTGLAHDRDRLPKAEDVLALGLRLTLWEAIENATALVQLHNGTHFMIVESISNDEDMRKEWTLRLYQGNQSLNHDALHEALNDWKVSLTETVIAAAPGRFCAAVLDSNVRTDQLTEIQDLIFGSGMVAIWREQRTPTFDDQPMPETNVRRDRYRS